MAFSGIHDSDKRNRSDLFEIQKSDKNRKFEGDTLKQEVKSAVMERYDFEYQNMPVLIAFWQFRPMKTPTQEIKSNNFKTNVYHQAQKWRFRH